MEPELQEKEPSQSPFQFSPVRAGVVLISVILLSFAGWFHRSSPRDDLPLEESPELSAPEEILVALPTPLPPWPLYSHPTPQRLWAETDNPAVYQPTGSGRVESAGFGSVRTNSAGRATFHEGVDIAPVKKDSRGRALDPVYAISDGEVAYVNRVAGNSSYGIYVVLKHQDEVGPVYSLYAHLASVPSQIQAGKKLAMGDEIAVMGHTSTIGIPVQRSHLHLELCMMLNPSFDKWYRKQKLKPDHGRYHGFNFAGLNPKKLLIPLSGKEQIPFSFQQTLQETEPAWQLLLRTTKRPRYFSMYPQLWQGSPYRGRAMLLSVSESGIPLSGRNADEEEIRKLGSSDSLVSSVNEAVLGRNGTRHILKNRGQWILGANGKRWLEILIYDAE